MSLRTFNAIISHLRHTRPDGPPSDASVQWCKDVAAVAQALASVNRAFDPRRFVNDCLNNGPPR